MTAWLSAGRVLLGGGVMDRFLFDWFFVIWPCFIGSLFIITLLLILILNAIDKRIRKARDQGYEAGKRFMRKSAIDAGFGHWALDPKTGATEFVYGRPPE